MHVLMLLDKPYPPDLRVENEARSLLAAGMEVTLLSLSPEHQKAGEFEHEGVRVMNRPVGGKRWRAVRAVSAGLPGVCGPYVDSIIEAARAGTMPDAIHAHDLYLAESARRAAGKLGIPYVVDLHENWVGVLADYRWSSGFPRRLIVGRRRWKRKERRWLESAAFTVTVTAELAELVHRRSGIPMGRLVPLPNTVSLEGYGSWPVDEERARELAEVPRALYAGGLVDNRGLDDAIRSWPAVRARVPDAVLTVVGDGAARGSLEALAEECGVEDAVEFAGWVDAEAIPTWVAGSAVCINPLIRTAQTDVVISHKVFQYMLGSRPVVVTDCPPMRRFVEESGGGLVVPARDPGAFAEAVAGLLEDPERRRALGAQGREAVLSRMHWSHTAARFVEAYKRLGTA